MDRGECFRIKSPRGTRGGEQRGERYGVIVQSNLLLGLGLSTVLLAPTSKSARGGSFRPTVDFGRGLTKVLAEQTNSCSVERLGESVGRLSNEEMNAVDDALRIVLGLR